MRPRKGFLVVVLFSVLCGDARAATFTVSNTNDAGAGSLRAAIINANTAGGADTIDFSVGPGSVISPGSLLPPITEALTIDGPGSGPPQVRIDAVGLPA